MKRLRSLTPAFWCNSEGMYSTISVGLQHLLLVQRVGTSSHALVHYIMPMCHKNLSDIYLNTKFTTTVCAYKVAIYINKFLSYSILVIINVIPILSEVYWIE